MEYARKITILPQAEYPNPALMAAHKVSKFKDLKAKSPKVKPKTSKSILSKGAKRKRKSPKSSKRMSKADAIKKLLRPKNDDRSKWKHYGTELQKLMVKPQKDVLKNVKYKPRAIKLLDSLNGIVTWDGDGTVSVKGRVIPYSHIADLVEAHFDQSKSRPVGWGIFKRVLPQYGETKDKGTQWEEWPPKRSPKPRKVKRVTFK